MRQVSFDGPIEERMPTRQKTLWNPLCGWLSSRALAPLCVLVLSILAFRNGVDVTDRGAIPDADFFTQLYYSLGLFVLGGMDLGTPTGGPLAWRVVLWTMYFMAPTIAAVTVVEGLWRTFRPWLTTHWPWRRHVVIAGAGHAATACVDLIRARYPRVTLLIVERQREDSHWNRLQGKPNVHLIHGDVTDPMLLGQLHLQSARAMFLLTDNEFANIEVATRIRDAVVHPKAATLPLLVRVSNLTLLAAAQPLMSDTTVLVNLHQGVAKNFHRSCAEHMRETQGRDVLCLAGFGRFSKTFLRCFLTDESSRELRQVHIIDPHADLCWAQFADTLDHKSRGALESKLALHSGHVEDPRVWTTLLDDQTFTEEEALSPDNLVVVLATSSYEKNLQTALVLRAKMPRAFLAVRTFERSAFSERVAQSQEIVVVYAADELKERISAHWLPRLGL
jgi:hypothetical protein